MPRLRWSIAATALMVLMMQAEHAAAQSIAAYVAIVDLDIVPAERKTFLAAARENARASIKEPGCRQYDVLLSADDPNHVVIYEVFDDEAAAQAHQTSDHFKEYWAATVNIAKRSGRLMRPVSLNSRDAAIKDR